jgi:bifunctional DNA-binding transcriptional regulator/antitoxin component of YhaV-PrlF toxin-antitoxin module
MLASETVRQAEASQQPGVTEAFEELVVLDKNGRLHIPPEYLEELQIRGRARLEVVEGGILIRKVEEAAPRARQVAEVENTSQSRSPLRDLWGRLPGKRG